jgi:Outer membrane protein beta-barrel domain
MKKIILALALLGMLQTTVAQKKKKSSSKTTTITASEPVVRSSSSSSSSSTSSSSSAQEGFRQSDIFVSGSFGYTSSKDAGVSTSKTSILPSLGYFIKDNIALVGTVGFESNDTGVGSSTNSFVLGAAARYYMTPTSKFSLFGEAGIGFKSGDNTTILTVGVSPGLNYFLNNHFSVEATVGEFGIVNTSGGGASNTDLNFGADLTKLGLGLNYKF